MRTQWVEPAIGIVREVESHLLPNEKWFDGVRRLAVNDALRLTNGNQGKAAVQIDMGARNFGRLCKRYGLRPKDQR